MVVRSALILMDGRGQSSYTSPEHEVEIDKNCCYS